MAAPWRQALAKSLEANKHLKYSTFMQVWPHSFRVTSYSYALLLSLYGTVSVHYHCAECYIDSVACSSRLLSCLAQLATVRTDGRPAVRTVVFRGFHGDSNLLTFNTDTRCVPALLASTWSTLLSS